MRNLYTLFQIHLNSRYLLKKSAIALLTLTAFLSLQACNTNPQTYTYNAQPWLTPSGAPITSKQPPSDLSIASVQRQPLSSPTAKSHKKLTIKGPDVKVAILLPLSGKHAKLGQSMLNAAQMAVMDLGHENFTIIPYDTHGTTKGARNAARNAIKDGTSLMLGPVFAHSLKAAKQITENTNINIIAFSTDWSLASSQTFLIGFLPFDQVERVINYADYNGYKKICAISPDDTYGNTVASAYQASISRTAPPPNPKELCISSFSSRKNSLSKALRNLSQYDRRKASREAIEQKLIDEGQTAEQARMQTIHEFPEEMPFDAILMPVGGPLAREVGNYLNHYDLPPEKVKRLGTGLMDDINLAQDKALNGAWFAAPQPQVRSKFKRRYKHFYNKTPPRLASISYDATALAAILARIGIKEKGRPAYDSASITNPNGFSGVDGIFRFHPNGIVERGLAVLEYKGGHIYVIDDAPKTFQNRID